MSYVSIEAAIEDYESQLCACEDRLSRLQAENERLKKELSAVVWRLESRIAALKAQLRWIPVGEGLPKDDGNYNITDAQNRVFAVRYKVKYGWNFRNIRSFAILQHEITHWMPITLPEEAQNDLL